MYFGFWSALRRVCPLLHLCFLFCSNSNIIHELCFCPKTSRTGVSKDTFQTPTTSFLLQRKSPWSLTYFPSLLQYLQALLLDGKEEKKLPSTRSREVGGCSSNGQELSDAQMQMGHFELACEAAVLDVLPPISPQAHIKAENSYFGLEFLYLFGNTILGTFLTHLKVLL